MRGPTIAPEMHVGDVVVADAERARRDDADEADDDRTDCGPPHPVDVKVLAELLEAIFDCVRDPRDAGSDDADDDAEHRIRHERDAARLRKRRNREDRRGAAEGHANARGDRRRERDGDERARTILEQQQLDGEEHGAHRAAEGRRHSRGGAGGEERLALVGRDVQQLAAQRAERAAGRDDRSLGAERSAGADGDRRGERLEKEHARRDAALAEQHALHHLGNAVAADGRRAVARHEPDDDCAAHGDRDDEQRIVGAEPRHDELCRQPSVEGGVRHEADEPNEQLRSEPCANGDDDRARADADGAPIDCCVLWWRAQRES